MATNVHITHIEDTWANVLANADHGQLAILNDVTATLPYDEMLWLDDDATDIYIAAAQKRWNISGASYTFLDADFDKLTSNDDTDGILTAQWLRHLGDTDTRIQFQDDQITITVGGVNAIDIVEAGTDSITLNMDLTLAAGTQNYLVTTQSTALAIQSQTAATNFELDLFTADGDGTDSVLIRLYGIGTPTSVDPAEWVQMNYDAGGTEFQISTQHTNSTLRSLVLFTEGNTNQLVAYTDGNVGVGIAVPTAKLHVSSATATAFAGAFVNTANDGHGVLIQGGGSSGARYILQLKNNAGTERMVVTDVGWLGLGTILPGARLEVVDTSTQLKLSFDGTDNCTFAVDTDGDLTVTPSGTSILIASKLAFTQTDLNEYIDSDADGYLDYYATTANRFHSTTLMLDKLAFTQTDLNEYIDSDADGYLDYYATTANGLHSATLMLDKLAFTQTDLNEYIDSDADGYLDYHATTGQRFHSDNYSFGATTQNRIVKIIPQKALVDNTASDVFKIETTDETGNNDAGGYVCKVYAMIGGRVIPTSISPASKGFCGVFTHVSSANTGFGDDSAVTEVFETASAAVTPASVDISTVTMSTVATTNYQTDIQFLIDTTGTVASPPNIYCVVELLWFGYNTAPTITAL